MSLFSITHLMSLIHTLLGWVTNALQEAISTIIDKPYTRGSDMLQSIAKTGRAVTAEELLWISRDTAIKQDASAWHVLNLKNILRQNQNIGIPMRENYVNLPIANVVFNSSSDTYTEKPEPIFKSKLTSLNNMEFDRPFSGGD